MEKTIGEFTMRIDKDDRGRIVAEVWHTKSGKTLAITEVDTVAEGEHWAKKTIEMSGAAR